MRLDVNEKDWHFVEGVWSQDTEGVISAPADLGDRNIAINTTSFYQANEERLAERDPVNRLVGRYRSS